MYDKRLFTEDMLHFAALLGIRLDGTTESQFPNLLSSPQ